MTFDWTSAMSRLLPGLALGILVVVASLCCSGSSSFAAGGDEPWCIIDNEGNLHCWYANSQACLQQIASGSRGFCVQNPSGSSAASAPEPQPRVSRRKK
jgi:hypothetical protein